MICMGDNDSVGEDNPYGQPTVQTLNALQQHGLPYVRLRYTDGQGALKPLTRGLIHVSVKGGTLLRLGNGRLRSCAGRGGKPAGVGTDRNPMERGRQ